MRSDARKRLADLGRAAGHRHDSWPLVGVMGKKRAGKDTFAGYLVEEHGFRRFAFADPLKEAALHLNPIVGRFAIPDDLAGTRDLRLREVVEALGWEKAKECPEIRRTLQEYGMSIRAIQEDFWIRATLDPALEHRGPRVVTDVRFPNEARAIRQAGGVLVRIVRPGLVSTDTHASETALDGYRSDFEIVNETLEDLQIAALAVAKKR